MAIPSFYHPDLSSADIELALSANEASHAIKSRRLRVDQEVRILNGSGLIGIGHLTRVERREVIVAVSSVKRMKLPSPRLIIATALPKGDRQKVMLDMLTQLGVSEIIPLRCERSVTRFSGNMADKWRRVMIEACKQSQNPWLPDLGDEIGLLDLLKHTDQTFVYADAMGERAQSVFAARKDQTILIGPEGGFSDSEFAMLKAHKVSRLSLGGHILRTEAAAIAAAAQFNASAIASRTAC